MTIVRLTDPIEHYRHIAAHSDIHALAGHGFGVSAIHFTNSNILAGLDLGPHDILLDIGCGDGSLLYTASSQVSECMGVIPTVEEQQRLLIAYPRISFLVGLAQKLPLESESVSKIVCNSVLLVFGTEDEVITALREIARVARPRAGIWIGEIPAANEFEQFNIYSGGTLPGLLWHQFRHKGLRPFFGTCKLAVRSLIGRDTLEIVSYPVFYSAPERFTQLIDKCGLKVQNHFKHQRLDTSGQVIESPFRYNYLVTK